MLECALELAAVPRAPVRLLRAGAVLDWSRLRRLDVPALVVERGTRRVRSANRTARQLLLRVFGIRRGVVLGEVPQGAYGAHDASQLPGDTLWLCLDSQQPSRVAFQRFALGKGRDLLICTDAAILSRASPNSVARGGWLVPFLMGLPMPAWVLSSSGEELVRNSAVDQMPLCQFDGCSRACGAARRTAYDCPVPHSDEARPGIPSFRAAIKEVLRGYGPLVHQYDLGYCGRWQLLLWDPGGLPKRVVAMAFDQSELFRERNRAEAYGARVKELLVQFETVRETERSALSRDLHDQLGQELTVVGLSVARLRQQLAGQADSEIESALSELSSQVCGAVATMRRIAHGLRPEALGARGLVVLTQELVQLVSRQLGVRGSCALSAEWHEPDEDLRLQMLCCIQELLNNMAKHAHATRFFVSLTWVVDGYVVRIEDNGRGVPPSVLADFAAGRTAAGHHGLDGLRERVKTQGGTVSILSRPDFEGTCTILVFSLVAAGAAGRWS